MSGSDSRSPEWLRLLRDLARWSAAVRRAEEMHLDPYEIEFFREIALVYAWRLVRPDSGTGKEAARALRRSRGWRRAQNFPEKNGDVVAAPEKKIRNFCLVVVFFPRAPP